MKNRAFATYFDFSIKCVPILFVHGQYHLSTGAVTFAGVQVALQLKFTSRNINAQHVLVARLLHGNHHFSIHLRAGCVEGETFWYRENLRKGRDCRVSMNHKYLASSKLLLKEIKRFWVGVLVNLITAAER
jgi:hypothetical protein